MPVDFDPENQLHCQFITAIACLRANVFKIEIPSKTPRTEEFRKVCGIEASKLTVAAFVPNDEKAKEIQASVDKEAKDKETEEEKSSLDDSQQIQTASSSVEMDFDTLMKRFKHLLE